MPAGFIEFLEWVESSMLAVAIRQSTWLYPFIEIIHIFGIVLVAGAAGLFDLQVLSRKKRSFIELPAIHLLTWSKRGLILAIPAGIMLFTTNALALAHDPVFQLKLFLLLLAAFNAWIFHLRVYLPFYKQPQFTFKWNKAKLHALVSLLLWMSIISCGRLLAY